jgi:hypothetical protein
MSRHVDPIAGGVGEAANAEVTAFSSKYDPDLYPQPKQTYSEWMREYIGGHLTMENSTASSRHVSDGGQIHWLGFADWARNNIHELPQTLTMWMEDENNWIFKMFPIRETRAQIFKQSFIEISPQIPGIETMKTPHRNIHARMYSRMAHTVYSGTGFEMDYNHLITPDGIEQWDMQVANAGTHVFAFLVDQTLNEVRFENSYFTRPEQLYPFGSVPHTADDLFEYEHARFGRINKDPQAIHDIIKDANTIFGQQKRSTKAMITSRDDMWYFRTMDRTEIDYSASGPVSIANRNRDMKSSVDGVQIYPVPLQAGRLHDTVNEHLLRTRVVRGSFADFPERALGRPPCEYKSYRRTIKYGSWTTNQLDDYTFIDFLRHCFQFNHPQCAAPAVPGEINREILQQLITQAPDVYRNMQTEYNVETKARLDPLIRFDQATQNHHVINCFGEMAECFAKTSHLKFVAQTIECRVFEGLTMEQKKDFEAGMVLAKELQDAGMDNRIDYAIPVYDEFVDTENLGPFGAPSLRQLIEFFDEGVVNDDNAETWEILQNLRMYGFGNINGFLEIHDAAARLPEGVIRQQDIDTISRFLKVYRLVVHRLYEISPKHAAFSPALVPGPIRKALTAQGSSSFIIKMTSMWYTICTNRVKPMTHLRGKPIEIVAKSSVDHADEYRFAGSGFAIVDSLMDDDKQFVIHRSGGTEKELLKRGLNAKVSLAQGDHNVFFKQVDNAEDYYDYTSGNAVVRPQYPLPTRDEREGLPSLVNYLLEGQQGEVDEELYSHQGGGGNKAVTTQGLVRSYLTDFETRWIQSHSYSWALGICARFLYSQTINIPVLESFYANNIAIPFGGTNLRPAETQAMTSQVMHSAEKVGQLHWNGVGHTVGFDQYSQHYNIQVFWSCRPLYDDPKNFLVMHFNRGDQIAGGKGNKYCNDQVDLLNGSTAAREIKEAFKASAGEHLIHNSNIPALAGYNYAIDERGKFHMDLRGNWRPEDFQGRMTESEHFQRMAQTLNYDGQPLINMIFDTFGPPQKTYPEKLTYAQFAELQGRNFHLHRPTMIVFDSSGNRREDASHHPWGREQDGLATMQQSMDPVDR